MNKTKNEALTAKQFNQKKNVYTFACKFEFIYFPYYNNIMSYFDD